MAVSNLYRVLESPIVFKVAPGPVTITLASLANNAGRVSDRVDRGVVGIAAANRFIGRAHIKLAVAAAIGATCSIYAVAGDGTDADGGLPTGDAAVVLDKFRNLTPIGTISADAATVGPFIAPISVFEFDDRYLQLAVKNEMGQAFTATGADHYITIWPAPMQSQ